jgi:hypothetical protein
MCRTSAVAACIERCLAARGRTILVVRRARYRPGQLTAHAPVRCPQFIEPWESFGRTPRTTPSNLHITATTPTRVSLAWSQSTDNSSNFWYCVQTNGSGCIRVDPPRTTLTRTISLPNRTFEFSVYAIDSAGNRSSNSNAVSFTTLSCESADPVEIFVKAVDTSGNMSGPSNTVIFTDCAP